jgi:NAD-dependent DNA ligase
MTGFRDTELETKIINVGGKIVSSVSKNTFAVLIKNTQETSLKVDKANELGVAILSREDFIKQYI